MSNNKQYDIFLSHSSCDKSFCDKLYNLLEDAGFSVWYDETSLLPNSHLTSDLPDYIKKCRSLIVVLSNDSCKSDWVKEEYAYAKDLYHKKELTIIPIVIDDCEIPGFYNNYKWIDCKKGLTPFSFFMILSAMYGSSENMRKKKDVYVSYSWRKEEQKLVEIVFDRLKRNQYRLIGDAGDQSAYDENNRIGKIMDTCGAYVGILPYRKDSNTSAYILDEIKIAQEHGLPGILIADDRIKGIDEYTSIYKTLKVNPDEESTQDKILDFISELKPVMPKKPHVFFATNLDKQRKTINGFIRNLSGYVTSTRCILGEDIDNTNLQQQIINRIKNAYVMIADITGDSQCYECEKPGTESKDKIYRFNTCIEAGIARGADTDLFIIAKEPRKSPPFMFRDINVRYYNDDCELLAIIHKVLRGYRRTVL